MARLLLDTIMATFWFDDALQASLQASGFLPMPRSQSFVFASIALGERRAANMAKNLGVSRQAISLMLNDLEKRGIIVFVRDPRDGRARIIQFSESFLKQGQAALAILKRLEQVLEKRIGKDRVQAMRDAFAPDWGEPPLVEYTPRK